MFLQTNFWACATVMEDSGFASIYLVAIKYFTCSEVRGNGPRRSIPRLENGHEDMIIKSFLVGAMWK